MRSLLFGLPAFFCCLGLNLGAQADDPARDTQAADRLVQTALRAELDGDPQLRSSLLADALTVDPGHASARWQSGYIQDGKAWLKLHDAESQEAGFGKVAEYRQRRNTMAGVLAGEVALARWCRQQGEDDLERLHWFRVLQLDPTCKEARARLAVREFRGRLMTADQIVAWKQAMKQHKESLETWTRRLNRWQREIDESSTPYFSPAWQERSSVNDPLAVPALEKLFHRSDVEEQKEILSILGNIQDQASTDALVRLTLLAESSEIRQASAERLSKRSWYGFVPSLLSQLETPIEYQYELNRYDMSVVSQLTIAQEGSSARLRGSQRVEVDVPPRMPGGIRNAQSVDARVFLWQDAHMALQTRRQYERLRQSVLELEKRNARTQELNDRVYAALKTATGLELESRPRYWWDWWREYNDLYESDEKPVVRMHESYFFNTSVRPRYPSCFAAGTPVWTDTGVIAIEKIRPGDRVLSQDPISGELSYKMVLDNTTRPPSTTLRLKLPKEEIVTTPGHPMWKVGKGWVMAKELAVGDRLHSIEGGVLIEEIETNDGVEAYNLVVAETNTYFVGNHRLFVHDNSLRGAINIPLPGWTDKGSH